MFGNYNNHMHICYADNFQCTVNVTKPFLYHAVADFFLFLVCLFFKFATLVKINLHVFFHLPII